MSQSNQALWFDAVQLLVVAALYLGAAALLARHRGRRSEPGVLAVFLAVGLVTGVYGIVLAVERDVPPGGTWLTFGLAVLLGLPALLVLKSAARPESTSVGPERGR